VSDALGEQGKNSEVPAVLKKIEDLTKVEIARSSTSYSGRNGPGRFYDRIGGSQQP